MMQGIVVLASADSGHLDAGYLVVVVLFGVIAVGALAFLPKIWRMEAAAQQPDVTRRLPFGQALRGGFVRSMPVGVVTAFVLWLAMTAGFFETLLVGTASQIARTLGVYLGIAFVLGLFLGAGIALFNRPRFVVPPAARAEPGALTAWWRSRHKQPRKRVAQ